MPNKSVTLYHAEWCGFCQQFKPVWNQLTKRLNKKGVLYADYEHGRDRAEVEQAGIRGFPTIKINNGNETYEYKGPRTVEGILSELGQAGGRRNGEIYKAKYMKYKQKYITLKKLKQK